MKKLFYVAAAMVLSTSLVSCKKNKNESQDFKPSLDTNTSCSIKVVGSYDNFEALEAEFERFNDYYPNVELTYRKPDNYSGTLANSLTSEDRPNIFFSSTSWMSDETGTYDAITSHMEDLSDPALSIPLDNIRQGLINRDANNKVVMLPVFSRTYGTLVNTDLFAKEGLTYPTTWTELLNVCQAFVSKGYTSPMMGYSQNQSVLTKPFSRKIDTLKH